MMNALFLEICTKNGKKSINSNIFHCPEEFHCAGYEDLANTYFRQWSVSLQMKQFIKKGMMKT